MFVEEAETGEEKEERRGRMPGKLTLPLALLTVAVVALALLFGPSFAAGLRGPSGTAAVPAQTGQQPPIPGMPRCDGPTPEANVPADMPTLPPTAADNPALTAAPTNTAQQPTPINPRSVFSLAWFHKPPEDGSTAAQIAQSSSYIHLTGPSDIPFRNELRAAGYKGPIYTYVTASAVEGPGPYRNSSAACASGYTPYDNNLAWKTDDFCRNIHPHESWFLHNGKGERLVDDYFGSGRWTYMMNPADPGWQTFAQERLLYIKDNWGYDGVWLDNVDLDLNRARAELHNHDGAVQEFNNDGAWQAATRSWLAGVRQKLGKWPVWANLVGGGLASNSWDAYASYLDGAMDESFSVRWLDGWRDPQDWQSQLERADKWLQSGKGLVMVGQGAKDDGQRLHFTLASYLLVAQGQQSFYRYTRFDTYYNALWLYPDFNTARNLGAPTGPRTEVKPGIWQRQFTNGTVQVDLAAHEGKLTVGGK